MSFNFGLLVRQNKIMKARYFDTDQSGIGTNSEPVFNMRGNERMLSFSLFSYNLIDWAATNDYCPC